MPDEVTPDANFTILVRGKDGKVTEAELKRSQLKRLAMGKKLAETRMWLIKHVHRTERGVPIDLKINPQLFQAYADPHPDKRMQAPAQFGKSLYAVVDIFATVECGLQVGFVMPKEDLRNQFVSDKINRTIKNTP